MKSRLIRPALTALVSGALVAGGAVYASPALAEEPTTPAVAESESASPSPSESVSESESASPSPSAGESESESASPSPSVSAPQSESASPSPSQSSASPVPSTSVTPPKDTTGPNKANFKLNYTSLWLGQVDTFTQTAADLNDPTDAPAQLSRIVSWGDGTTTKVAPSTTTLRKTYTRKGSFKVTVTVADPAGNRLVTPAKTVAVTLPTASVAVSKKSVYQGQPFTYTVKKVPAGATYFVIHWGNGIENYYKAKNGTKIDVRLLRNWRWDPATQQYVPVGAGKIPPGKKSFKISWYNAKGYTVYQPAGGITILKDSWKPALTITKPSSPSRASAWKTVKGTITDKGAGIRHLGVTVVRVTSANQWYCLTPARKWKRVTSDAAMTKYCYSSGVKVKIAKGKWSLSVPSGIARNQEIWVEAWSYDFAENYKGTYRNAKITRS